MRLTEQGESRCVLKIKSTETKKGYSYILSFIYDNLTLHKWMKKLKQKLQTFPPIAQMSYGINYQQVFVHAEILYGFKLN